MKSVPGWGVIGLALFLAALALLADQETDDNYGAAVTLVKAGKLDAARTLIEAAYKDRAKPLNVVYLLAVMAEKQERPAEALTCYREVLRRAASAGSGDDDLIEKSRKSLERLSPESAVLLAEAERLRKAVADAKTNDGRALLQAGIRQLRQVALGADEEPAATGEGERPGPTPEAADGGRADDPAAGDMGDPPNWALQCLQGGQWTDLPLNKGGLRKEPGGFSWRNTTGAGDVARLCLSRRLPRSFEVVCRFQVDEGDVVVGLIPAPAADRCFYISKAEYGAAGRKAEVKISRVRNVVSFSANGKPVKHSTAGAPNPEGELLFAFGVSTNAKVTITECRVKALPDR